MTIYLSKDSDIIERTPLKVMLGSNASAMTNFHLDVYAPSGTNFRVELVSFDAGGGLVNTDVLELNATTTPAFNSGGWSSLDIPLTDFVLPTGFDWSRVAQLVLSTGDAQLVLVDNVFFYGD